MSELGGIKFRPVMGTEDLIKKTGQSNGWMYVATDTGNMYLDVENRRISIGGAGGSGSSSSFVWADGDDELIEKLDPEDDDSLLYLIDIAAIESGVMPKPDYLILNSDGRFFRVIEIDMETGKITGLLIAVSGTSGGGGGVADEKDIELSFNSKTIQQSGSVFISGQNYEVEFTPAAIGSNTDTICWLRFDVVQNGTVIKTRTENSVRSKSKYYFNTAWLPEGTGLTLRVTVGSPNSEYKNGEGRTYNFTSISVVEMRVEKAKSMDYIPMVTPGTVDRTIKVNYIPIADKKLNLYQHVFIDGVEEPSLNRAIETGKYGDEIIVDIPEQSHGVHIISFSVSAIINDVELFSNEVAYQAAWAEEGNEAPIIWVGKYDEVIVNYETSYIEFMAYDPIAAQNSQPATVILYKENVEVGQMEVEYSGSGFVKWDISTLYEVGENNYAIACRTAMVNITNTVTTEGSRDLGLADEAAIMLNYSAAGRMNTEILSQRQVFADKKTGKNAAVLKGFNWKNNGWGNDGVGDDGIDYGSYLNIANGATVEIPFQSVTLNSDRDYTIEMRFRIKNIQKYSTLVQSFAKYFINTNAGVAGASPSKSGSSYTMAEVEKQAEAKGIKPEELLFYDEYGSPVMDETVQKELQTTEGVVIKWMENETTKIGLCIGTQEAYFNSPRGTVSVRYKEDEIINLSVVISRSENLCYIYLNGILSGADALPPAGTTGQFSINSNFKINSEYCDIDLYRFRVYQTGLTMPKVIHNYLSDIHSIVLYDQNQLTSEATKLSYEKLIQYNEEHPEAPTMPYAVWKITSDNKKGQWSELLPYYKGNGQIAEVTFVNTPLDRALEDGIIDEYYYYTHSPSYHAINVEIDVQGTSSQGYPRRNYKTKFKKAAPTEAHPEYGWFYTKGSLAGKMLTDAHTVLQTLDASGKKLGTPVERKIGKKFHMDNYTIGTNKFTWKIDYMESSGTYNTGYANLMGNKQHPLYIQHPLDYYPDIKDVNTDEMRTTVYGFPVLTFHEYEDEKMNPSKSGKYEYIGRYNMNLDKGSNEYYGFEEEATTPYVLDEEGNPQPIANIAECWELSDNQGTWCSFKYPSKEARRTGFRTTQVGSGKEQYLEVPLHFEYRYSHYADQIDAIGATGLYDGSSTERDKFKDEIGTTVAEYSDYLYDRYANLEEVFNWLDSTDQEEATGDALPADKQITMRSPKPYNGDGEHSEPVNGYVAAAGYSSDPSIEYYIKEDNGNYRKAVTSDFQLAEGSDDMIVGFKSGVTYYISSIMYYNTTFTKDTAGYRLEKFRREFEDHFNKEYCLVYYIMTELLLCYDSRGKNMMLASFGPNRQKRDGEDHAPYVWFPIFYDIDTQLGLNNSGAYLWDYDADVSKDGLFSTPTSVLWINLWDAFETDIKGKYRVLRGSDDKSNVVGSLTYDNIAGAYSCDSTVFDSYAMKGLRPTIAIGLDEYYKYFATTTASGVGYFDTNGDLIKESSPTFAYACQGDKKLTTELLLQNRLNYIDSWWAGGDYDITKVKGGELALRVSANRATETSDTYLDSDSLTTIPSGFTGEKYPVAYYDAQPGYMLKPFLKQYVFYFTDEIPGDPVKYDGVNVVRTHVPESTIQAYKTAPETPNEQLNYIPGLDYLSSLGDLSTSYISEFQLRKGKRLLDLILGSDAPDYKNNLISSKNVFNLAMSAGGSGAKPLMRKINLTGLFNLDETLNITGSPKLQEFRALNTVIPDVYLADGAPLHTLHLPKTVQTIKLIQNNELTKMLDERPKVWENKDNPEAYKGLYIEGITDATLTSGTPKATVLMVDGGGLGYEAYRLLDKFVTAHTNGDQKVRIGMINQHWTPYVQVEQGEVYGGSGTTYYLLNDHNMFEKWTFTTKEDWDKLTLNGVLYTLDAEKDKQTKVITSLKLFDKFLEAYEVANAQGTTSKWGMQDDAQGRASVPTLTGMIFVDNDESDPIDEAELSSKYNSKWPNLTITARNIKTSNLTKYVQVDDKGRETVLAIQRTTGNKPELPARTMKEPSVPYYNFAGWSLQNPSEVAKPELTLTRIAEGQYTESDAWNALAFDGSTTVITLYAVFTPQVFTMTFRYADETEIAKVQTEYGQPINLPSTVPYQDESELPFDEKYAFLGYAYQKNATRPLDLSKIIASKDTIFYAIFETANVHSNPIASDYYITSEITTDDFAGVSKKGLSLTLNPKYSLTGKVTLPSYVNGVPVLQFGEQLLMVNTGEHRNITHIFWDTSEGEPQVLRYATQTFQQSVLKYVEFPPSLFRIDAGAFQSAILESMDVSNVRIFGSNSFNSFHLTNQSEIYLTHATSLLQRCFAYIGQSTTFHFGSESVPSPLENIDTNSEGTKAITPLDDLKSLSMIVHTDRPDDPIWQQVTNLATNGGVGTVMPM